MKITRKPLLSALQKMTALKSSSFTGVNCVKVEASGETAKISRTDLEIWMTFDCPAGGELVCAMPLLPLKNFCAQSSAEEISIEIDKQRLSVTDKRSSAKLNIVPLDYLAAFPAVPKLDEVEPTILQSLKSCVKYVRTEERLGFFAGVALEAGKDGPKLVASDGRSLIVADVIYPALTRSGIIPKEAAQLIVQALGGSESLQMALEENMVHFAADGLTVSAKLVDATILNWRQIIPADRKYFKINREAWISMLESAALFTSERIAGVNIESDGKQLFFRVGEEEFQCTLENETPVLETCVTPLYVLDFLKECQGDEIEMSFEDPLSPLTFKEGGMFAVVMPLRVS